MTRETPLQALENETRKIDCGLGHCEVTGTINGHTITVRRQKVMVNRGMATGMTDRFTYYIDGKRVAYGKAWEACK